MLLDVASDEQPLAPPPPPAATAAGLAAAPSHSQQLQLHQQQAMPHVLHTLGWRRPQPRMASGKAEWQWLPVRPDMGLLWDSTMTAAGSSNQAAEAAYEVVHKALGAPLLPAQQQSLLSLMAADPQLVHALQLQPAQLAPLVEHNPLLAHQVLACLAGSRRAAGFYEVLAHMPLSLHSMEVVNRLAASGHLPDGVVHLYVSNCINSCDNITDKFMQSRLVRLVCVFLQSLIRYRATSISQLLLELQAFCVRYSRIREAATLFRVLKQMEHGGSSSPVAASAPAAQQSSPSRDL